MAEATNTLSLHRQAERLMSDMDMAKSRGDYAAASRAALLAAVYESQVFNGTRPNLPTTRGIIAISACSLAFSGALYAWKAGDRAKSKEARAYARSTRALILALNGEERLPDWARAQLITLEADMRREAANRARRWRREHKRKAA